MVDYTIMLVKSASTLCEVKEPTLFCRSQGELHQTSLGGIYMCTTRMESDGADSEWVAGREGGNVA